MFWETIEEEPGQTQEPVCGLGDDKKKKKK